jgi:hypothetical protein
VLGKLVRGMKAKHVRTGKSIGLHAPHFFFAQDRAIADEAYAGDVVGIPNHGNAAHRRHPDRGRGPSISSACRASRRKSCAGSGSPTP